MTFYVLEQKGKYDAFILSCLSCKKHPKGLRAGSGL